MNVAKKQKGFSLIEILVVIAIMGIMAIFVIPRYASNKKAKAINFAKTQIVNDMRYVQNSTLNGMKFPGDAIPPQGGFGINIKKGNNYFIIFGDKDNKPNRKYDASNDEILETVALEGGTYISELKQCTNRSCGSSSSLSKIDYVCVPPYGTGFINNIATGQEIVVKITVSSPDDSMQSDFIISSSGYTNHTN